MKKEQIEETFIEGSFDGFIPFELHFDKMWVVGTYQDKENRLCISHANCEGNFKFFAEYLVKKFKTNKMLIYNVLSANWHLKGFVPKTFIDPVFNEPVICLEGEWNSSIPPTDKSVGILEATL